MAERTHIGLDNPVFRGRLRSPAPSPHRARHYADVYKPRVSRAVTASLVADPLPIIRPRPLAKPKPPSQPRLQASKVLQRQFVQTPQTKLPPSSSPRNYSKPQLALFGMACVVFMVGLIVSWQAFRTNHNAASQVAALSKQVDKQTSGNQNSSVPSTTRPSSQAISQYVVAPDLPRYLKIPKLRVYARVLQVGINASGALGTPPNVFDTAWYSGSAKPGQQGATLIDGHISSWTTHGVFYGLNKLAAGDNIQIIRGDGTVLNYQVVKTQVYSAKAVDMQAAITPITAGKSGLNLISCTGQVQPGTSQFNQRIIVFAQQL